MELEKNDKVNKTKAIELEINTVKDMIRLVEEEKKALSMEEKTIRARIAEE